MCKKMVQIDIELLEGVKSIKIKSNNKMIMEHTLDHAKKTNRNNKELSYFNSLRFSKGLPFTFELI